MTDLLQDVRKYYDSNTGRFQRHGQAGLSIHRAVWGPGVATRNSAVHFVDNLILTELQDFEPRPKVFDMGCGVGASLLYLAQRLPIEGEGVTISPLQAAQATKLFEGAQVNTLRCRCGNFLDMPSDIYDIDLAFSIEAFAHASDVAGYFSQAARIVRPGGRLVLCDDFLTPRGDVDPSTQERRWLQEFRQGWKIGSLVTVKTACKAARSAGFELIRMLDLTPFLELRRPRDILISFLVGIGKLLKFRGGNYWNALSGGNALQFAIRSGAVCYHHLVFERKADDPMVNLDDSLA